MKMNEFWQAPMGTIDDLFNAQNTNTGPAGPGIHNTHRPPDAAAPLLIIQPKIHHLKAIKFSG